VFKHNRKERYEELVAAGFMSFEALWLSTIPFAKHPAMSLIIRMRRRLQAKRIRESNQKGWSRAKRTKIWNARTRKMYRRRGWIARSDHPTNRGPRKGEENPFALYRHYEKNEVRPMGGDSKPPGTQHKNGEKTWALDRGQILLSRARQAWKQSDLARYQVGVAELDTIIARSQGKKQAVLTAARNKLPR
jgi:hypothetical protein